MKRRNFIVTGLSAISFIIYSLLRGIRMPPLIWEPRSLPNTFLLKGCNIVSQDVIKTQTPALEIGADISLRAFCPEPKFSISSEQDIERKILINNISPRARLIFKPIPGVEIEEQTVGINRILDVKFQANSQTTLSYELDVSNGYRFAAIGDTGGKKELEWCLQRAHALDALFFLHLGDFYYHPSDYESAIRHFNSAKLPCFVSIGNHDFRDEKTVYKKFLKNIGPLNSHFSLGGVRFANLDTASTIFPFGRGLRGKLTRLLDKLADSAPVKRTIAFTHRPIFDPIDEDSPALGNAHERDWLISTLQKAKVDTLLSGHLHIYDRRTVKGIDNIIVGQGLGHQDLITNQDYSKMAIGQVSPNGEVTFEMARLSMPWELHCHPRTNNVKEALRDTAMGKRIKELDSACADGSSTSNL